MKHRWPLIHSLIAAVVLLSLFLPMLPMKQIVIPSVTLQIIDEQTRLPLEGIKVHADCNYSKPKWAFWFGIYGFFGANYIGRNWTNGICFSEDFISDKNGMVTIPKRIKFSGDNGHIREYYWVNLSQILFDKNGLPDYFTTNSYPKSLDTLYDGIAIQRYNLSLSNKSPPWSLEANGLVQQSSSTFPEARASFIVKLRPRNSGNPQGFNPNIATKSPNHPATGAAHQATF